MDRKKSSRRMMIYSLPLSMLVIISCVFWNIPEEYWERNPAWSPDGRRIAFECYYGEPDWEGFYPDDGYEICVINADGKGYLRLTTNDRSDQYPTWSPDGNRIAFVSKGFVGERFTEKIMLIYPDGHHLAELVEGRGYLAWSPDGQYIAYQDTMGNLASVDVEDGETLQLSSSGDQGDDFWPAWSPDGQRIAFVSDRDDHKEIYVVNADGSDETRLTYGLTHSNIPTWSPDGKHIALLLDDSKSAYWGAIVLMEPDGKNSIQLTYRDTDGMMWASGGQYIIFLDYDKIFKINIDDGSETQLATISKQGLQDGWFNFSPDGRHIAIIRDDGPDLYTGRRIWIVNVDGSGEFKLTQR